MKRRNERMRRLPASGRAAPMFGTIRAAGDERGGEDVFAQEDEAALQQRLKGLGYL